MKNKVLKSVLLCIFVLAAIAGCKKDNVVPIVNGHPNDTTPIVDTLPNVDPGVDTLPNVDPGVDTLPDLTPFDTIPCSIDGFDIRGRWIWGDPNSPNRCLLNFRDDSIVVIEEYIYDRENVYVRFGFDSAMYRTYYSDSPTECLVTFYHWWRPNGHVENGYKYEYIPTVYDNQNTMFLYLFGYRTHEISPWEVDFYLTRYE